MKRDRMMEDVPIRQTLAINDREQVAGMPPFAHRRKKKDKDKNQYQEFRQPSQGRIHTEERLNEINLERPGLEEDDDHVMNINNQHGLDPKNYRKWMNKIFGSIRQTSQKKANGEQQHNQLALKQLLLKQKVKNICYQFIQKMKLNNPYAKPHYYDGFDKAETASIQDWSGFDPPATLVYLTAFVNIILVFALIFFYSVELVFPQFRDTTSLQTLQILSVAFFSFEILYTLLTKKTKSGRKLNTLKEIFYYYLGEVMIIDVMVVAVIAISLGYSQGVLLFFRLIIILKLPKTMQKVEKLQVAFIKNYYHEQYWALAKVAFFNICFAHILGIILIAMAQIDPQDNWYQNKGIADSSWFPKYVWAAYWGVNIMMTVGFGDIYAVNHKEALCLIFIEIFAVIALAYNISLIGDLISNIRAQYIEKKRNHKTFKQLNERYELSSDLEIRIQTFIEKSANMRRKFTVEEQNEFVKNLPKTMRRDYLKETNKRTFQKIFFFSSLVTKTLNNLAEKIQMSIVHPQELIRKMTDEYNLLILKEGEIGFTVKKTNCVFNGMAVDKLKVSNQDRPAVLGLEFLTRVRPIYQTKSLEYSAIFSMPNEELLNLLRESQSDYNHFCFLRDKHKNIQDQFEVFVCQVCCNGQKHTKFTCPKLHYIPLSQIVIKKEQYKEKTNRNKRGKFIERPPKERTAALKQKKIMHHLIKELQNASMSDPNSKASILSKHLLQQIKNINSIQVSKKSIKEAKLSEEVAKNTKYVIKEELSRMNRVDNLEDEVWLVECDQVENYKKYFPEGNASNLEYTFQMMHKMQDLQDNRLRGSIRKSSSKKIVKTPNKTAGNRQQ